MRTIAFLTLAISLVSSLAARQPKLVVVMTGDRAYEALFCGGDCVANAGAEPIRIPENSVPLTLGTSWREIKGGGIWHAEASPEREGKKDTSLKLRQPIAISPR